MGKARVAFVTIVVTFSLGACAPLTGIIPAQRPTIGTGTSISTDDVLTCRGTVTIDRGSAYRQGIDIARDCILTAKG